MFLFSKNWLVWFNIEVLKACLKACQNEPLVFISLGHFVYNKLEKTSTLRVGYPPLSIVRKEIANLTERKKSAFSCVKEVLTDHSVNLCKVLGSQLPRE